MQYHVTTRSQPVELVVTNSAMSTRSSCGSHRGREGRRCSQPTELVVTSPAMNTRSSRGFQQGGG